MSRFTASLLMAFALLCAPYSRSDTIVISGDDLFGASVPVTTAAARPMPTASPNPQSKLSPEEQQQKQQKLEKIQQLSFDRRPSYILLVWKKFELEKLKPVEETEPEADAEQTADSPQNAAEEDADQQQETPAEGESTSEKSAAEEDSASESSDESNSSESSSEERAEPEANEGSESEESSAGEEATSSESDAKESTDLEETESSESSTKVEQSTETSAKEQSTEKTTTSEQEQESEEKENSEESKESATSEEEKPDPKSEQDEGEEKEKDKGPDFDKQLADLKRDVTLGRWPQVGEVFDSMPEDIAQAIYVRLITTLASPSSQPAVVPSPGGPMRQVRSRQGGTPETNVLSADDLFAIAKLAPKELGDSELSMLARLIGVYQSNGFLIEDLIDRFESELSKDEPTFTRTQTAELLIQGGHTLKTKPFLPTIEEAVEQNLYKELIQLSKYFYASYTKDRKTEDLEKAWETVQQILAADKVDEAQEQQALMRAVDLAPQIRSTLGQAWLAEAFSDSQERGIEILSTIGNQAARGLQSRIRQPDKRLEMLRLQSTAVEALVKSSPELAESWQDKLTLLAGAWLSEAEISYRYDTSITRQPAMQRDMYGNIFYFNSGQMMSRPSNNDQPRPIAVAELLKVKPNEAWMKYVSESIHPHMEQQVARLLLKVNEEDEAFPYIERLAKSHPKVADGLVKEFLRVWTDNHDPNTNRNRTNSYMYMYGFERRAESIPLTRSKQQRNLEELTALVKRLNELPLEDVDEQQLVKAFTTCHSRAEVYELESIASVFGPLDSLKPKTLAALGQTMRTNLVGMWRMPATQKDAKTKRKQKDIAAEVERGYQVALAVIEGGLEKHPEDWSLVLAKASLLHDANDYRRTIAPDSKFVERQENSFSGFERAAKLYSATVGDIREEEESTEPFTVWFYASMGAVDPQRLEQEKPKDPKQLTLIREAILALPGEAAERHMDRLANSLFTRMSSVKPALKYRYLESGLAIVGDNERAIEARKVFDYYSDLVTEIKLECKLDGDDKVGHDQPFGVFVNLVHTVEIERESGGFTRYLQNQSNGNRYYYNYGRPLENYRDKFEEQVLSAVTDQFDVLSVTFQSEDVNSRSLPKPGWRYTPYAYIMLKAKGPEVDKLPAFQLDLDFLDTSGYVVLPIASPPLPVDANPAVRKPRPANNISITQTLDERQSDEGKLILEVKATSQGLVPDLDDLLSVEPEEFEIVTIEDEGLAVSRFDPESPENAIISERSWMVSMQANEGLPAPPESFEFAEPLVDVTESLYQRYDDADLLSVESVIDLEAKYASSNPWLGWWIAGAVLMAALVIGALVALAKSRPETSTHDEFAVPDRITPFSVLGLLDRIESRNGIDEKKLAELRDSRSMIERFYFEEGDSQKLDLEQIAQTWSKQARPRVR